MKSEAGPCLRKNPERTVELLEERSTPQGNDCLAKHSVSVYYFKHVSVHSWLAGVADCVTAALGKVGPRMHFGRGHFHRSPSTLAREPIALQHRCTLRHEYRNISLLLLCGPHRMSCKQVYTHNIRRVTVDVPPRFVE